MRRRKDAQYPTAGELACLADACRPAAVRREVTRILEAARQVAEKRGSKSTHVLITYDETLQTLTNLGYTVKADCVPLGSTFAGTLSWED